MSHDQSTDKHDEHTTRIPLADGKVLRFEQGQWALLTETGDHLRYLAEYESMFVDCALLAEAEHHAQLSATPGGERAGRIPELEPTRINAEYWLSEARHPDVEHSSALMFAEQAINAWKNAAYAAWDKINASRSATPQSDKQGEQKSDTPRCDAAIVEAGNPILHAQGYKWVGEGLARQLERELAEANLALALHQNAASQLADMAVDSLPSASTPLSKVADHMRAYFNEKADQWRKAAKDWQDRGDMEQAERHRTMGAWFANQAMLVPSEILSLDQRQYVGGEG